MADIEQQILGANPELQDVSRQRKLAELLMAQGMQQPQGQMISGYYVAPSFTQQLNPIANILAGQAVGERADTKQKELAIALRNKNAQDIQTYAQLQETDPAKAIQFGLASQNPTLKALVAEDLKTQKYGEGDIGQRRNIATGLIETVGKGAERYRAPTSVDMGTMGTMLIYPDGRREVVQKGREGAAGQVVETANGPMLVNTRTGAAQPIMGAGGQPLAPKLSAEQSKDITAINQQISTIDGAIKAIEKNPKIFSYSRGLAGDMPKGETIAARYQKPEETAARSYVFNNVSAVIKERAGTAQTTGEAKRLNSFLPDTYDDAKTIINKFEGFKDYLKDLEKGTRVNPNMPMQTQPTTPTGNQTPQFDPKLLQYMTPEQQALFKPKGQ
jgi:hypothetical protein